jgi:hypothetical protein
MVAVVGAVGALALVRQRDFVPSIGPGEPLTPPSIEVDADQAPAPVPAGPPPVVVSSPGAAPAPGP